MTSGSLGNNAKGDTRGDPFSKHVLVGAAEERAVGEGRADAKPPAAMSDERRPERG